MIIGSTRATIADVLLDFRQGLIHWRIWSALALNSLKMRYRRTVIGPFWITLQESIFIVALGMLFSKIQGEAFLSFFGYFAAGKTVWFFISCSIEGGSATFLAVKGLSNMTRKAYSTHVFLRCFSLTVDFLHVLPPLFAVLIYCGTLSSMALWAIPGFFLVLIFAICASTILGCLCLRFADLSLAISSLMGPMFFLTPIMYRPERLGQWAWIATLNPFYHLVAVCRSPLLGEPTSMTTWLVVIALDVVGAFLAIFILRRSRDRLAYWAG